MLAVTAVTSVSHDHFGEKQSKKNNTHKHTVDNKYFIHEVDRSEVKELRYDLVHVGYQQFSLQKY